MFRKGTEQLHDASKGLDQMPLVDAARLLADGQIAAAQVVSDAVPTIADAAQSLAETIREGGVIHYAAAGSSGLMSAADAQELGGTFSIPADQLRIHMAGGLPTGVEMPGGTEDDTLGLAERMDDLSERDCVIAVSASGSTPYTLFARDLARRAGATLIAIANNADAPLYDGATHAIRLLTPPEVLSGSTRMGAGTAQKIALNMLSTLMAIRLGHIHDGMMVNLRADNSKLRTRAAEMVARLAAVDIEAAQVALRTTGGRVKPAVLVAMGRDPESAEILLRDTEGILRDALARMN